ncbi:hypothetical protein ACSVDA_22830 [Cytobacillus sp. Hm23]
MSRKSRIRFGFSSVANFQSKDSDPGLFGNLKTNATIKISKLFPIIIPSVSVETNVGATPGACLAIPLLNKTNFFPFVGNLCSGFEKIAACSG